MGKTVGQLVMDWVQSELLRHQADLDLAGQVGLTNVTVVVHFNPKTGRPASILYQPVYRQECPGAFRVGPD